MTSLDWILLAWASGLAGIGIVYQGAKREVCHAYHRGHRAGRQTIEPQIEAWRDEGWQECIEWTENDRPAPPILTLEPATVTPATFADIADKYPDMEWRDPAHVPATVMAELEPATTEQPAIQAGELTLEFMRYRDEAEAEFRSIRQRAIAAISGAATSANRKD